jgi:hypothetical protein
MVSLDFLCMAHASFPECLSNHCQGLRHTFSEIYTKFDAHSLSDPMWNHIRPDTQFQIKGRKNQHVHPAVKFCTLTPKICQYYHLPLECAKQFPFLFHQWAKLTAV